MRPSSSGRRSLAVVYPAWRDARRGCYPATLWWRNASRAAWPAGSVRWSRSPPAIECCSRGRALAPCVAPRSGSRRKSGNERRSQDGLDGEQRILPGLGFGLLPGGRLAVSPPARRGPDRTRESARDPADPGRLGHQRQLRRQPSPRLTSSFLPAFAFGDPWAGPRFLSSARSRDSFDHVTAQSNAAYASVRKTTRVGSTETHF